MTEIDDVKQFIQIQRHFAKKYHEDKKGRDVEYGRCCGKLQDVAKTLDREEVEVDPLQMGVRVCPLMGAFHFTTLTPNCYTILHGTEGCAFMLKARQDIYAVVYQTKENLVTTAMSKMDSVLGAEEKLRKAIIEVDRDFHPDMIAVLKSCAPSVISDDITAVCESLRNEVNAILLPIEMSSFASRHLGLGRDEGLLSIAKYVIKPAKEKIPMSINLLGDNLAQLNPNIRPSNDPEEIARVFEKLGVNLHCHLPGRDGVEKWATASAASLNVLVCGVSGIGFSRYCEKHFGIPWVTVNRPFGVQVTTQFYVSVIDALGLGSEAEKVLEQEISETWEAIKPYRQKLKGKTFALSMASGRLVGIALLAMELGMEPVYICIHSLHEKLFPGLENLQDIFREHGYDPEVAVEGNFYEELEAIDRLKPDIWLLDGTQKNISVRHGQPYLYAMGSYYGGPQMGYRGCLSWAKQCVKLIEKGHIYRNIGAPHMYLTKNLTERIGHQNDC